jgi:hypothetical protein
MAASTDQAVNVGFHDDLQNTLCDCAQKISIPVFAISSASGSLSSVIGINSSVGV